MKNYTLVRSSKKTGKVDKIIDSGSKAMLSMWALQNTTKTKECYIIEADTGLAVDHFIGHESGFPKVDKDIASKNFIITLEEQ